MPLPPPDTVRILVHTRSIRVDGYERDDGKWDFDVELLDTKAYDFTTRTGKVFKTGDAIHNMLLRVTIDDTYMITAAVATYDAAPYDGYCSAIAPAYKDLVGMNLLRSFRQSVKDRFARTAGCTHMTELSLVLPTVAVQTMAGRRRKQETRTQSTRPFQLDGCYALRVDGPSVQESFPQWYVAQPDQTKRE